ncbi:MAG: polyketide synthase [Vicinamibacterales bacterium]
MVRVTGTGGVVEIALADPATGNALGETMVHALTSAIERAGAEEATRVVLLTGDGDSFSSGAPVALLAALAEGRLRPVDIRLPRVLLDCPVPVIAAMDGHAVGGGFALGLAADLVILARECRYGFTFLNLGFTPGMGTTALCEHALAPAVAHELLYTGELRRGVDFAGSGVNGVLPRRDVRARARDLAARIAEKPRLALELLKRTLTLPRRRAFEQALTIESLMHQVTLGGPGAADAIRGAYVD